MSHPSVAWLFEQSQAALASGQFDSAEALLLEALQLDPEVAEVHANLAWLLERRGVLTEAVPHYERAIELQPDNARIHVNFGALLVGLNYPHVADAAYQQALALDPAMPGAWCNLGALQAQNGRDEEAEQSLRTALALDATHAAAHVNLACLLLRKGRFQEGWQHLEFRDWYRPIETRLACTRWQGQALAAKSVLVVYEAGLGDMIQFCRYVTLLRSSGAAQVDVLCHPALKELLGTLEGVGDLIGFDEDGTNKVWDHWVPVLSLPFHLGTQLDTIPAHLPYLWAPEDKQAAWQKNIDPWSPGPELRVGLVWHGNPAFENDAERSLPDLTAMALLWEVPGVRFFSLQKGRGEQDVARWQASQPLVDLAPRLHNFADTAAAIAQMDLVISVDTAVAHLAGALGKRCWVLLPVFLTDWRWLEERTDSPWYPGVLRLFRQKRQLGWPSVMAEVGVALLDEVNCTQKVS